MSKYLVNPPQTVANAYEVSLDIMAMQGHFIAKINAIKLVRDTSAQIWARDQDASKRLGLSEAKDFVEAIVRHIQNEGLSTTRIVVPMGYSLEYHGPRDRAIAIATGIVALLGYGFRIKEVREVVV